MSGEDQKRREGGRNTREIGKKSKPSFLKEEERAIMGSKDTGPLVSKISGLTIKGVLTGGE